MDLLDYQRFITSLMMPLPLGLSLAACGWAMSMTRRLARAGLALVALGGAVIGIAALPVVAERAVAGLEGPFPARAPTECPRADAVVVLGGAVRPRVRGDHRGRLHQGSDRIWEAARLFHAGCAPRVVVSAGGQAEGPFLEGEYESIAAFLEALGVPGSALMLESQSRNTRSNAAFSRELLQPLGVKRVLLVTSAWHLRRAVALFEREGFEVIPVGADYRSFGGCQGLDCWVPSAEALDLSGLVVKEYIGYLVQVGW